MTQALRNIRTRALVIILIELIGIGGAIAAYFYNLFGFQDLMKPEYWIFALGGTMVINILFVWIVLLHISKIRKKSDLKAASIIGNDVQEAYNFGQIGLVVCDDNDIVMWTNNLFKERQMDLLDINITDWQPALKELESAPSDMVVKIEANGHNYDVKYLADAKLYIFKDSTEYEHIFAYSQEQAVALGIIMLDNYSDISGNQEDDINDVVSKVRGAIFDYAKEMGVLLRRFRSDSYFAVCNWASLKKMQDDGFSILATVRSLGKVEETIPTLSIGFAHDFPDVSKLNEMASNAIDIAMSRGGDQAVVSKYGEDIKYYGGKTQAVENTSKVKVRSIADSIISIIKESSTVYITGHKDMDMDALGSCLGMKAIVDWVNKINKEKGLPQIPCYLVYDPKETEKKARYTIQSAFPKAELDKLVISSKEAAEKVKETTLIIVCDVSVPTNIMAEKAVEKASKVIVIDHHRRGDKFVDRPVLAYIEPSASSASELVAEMIHYATANPRIELKQSYATIMLSGVFQDTNFFRSKSTGIRTFDACEILKQYGADNAKADEYIKDEFEEYALVTNIVSGVKTPAYGVVYCVVDEKDIVDKSTVAKVANNLMQIKGTNASFCIARTSEKEVKISARSDGTINVQLLCEKLNGGGHFTMAAAAFNGITIQQVEATFKDVINQYLNEARASKNTEGD